MTETLKKKPIAYLISIFCMFLWGSAFPTIKLTYQELNIGNGDYYSMIYVAGLRFFMAGLIVFILMLFFDKKNIHQFKTHFSKLLILSLIVTTFGYLFFYIGTGNTTGMKSALITSLSTFLVVIFSHYFLKDERFNRYKFIAIILGILGVIITNINKEFNLDFKFTGEGFMLLNSILNALGTIYVKKYLNRVSPFVVSSAQFLFGSVFLIIFGYFGMQNTLIFTGKSILLIIYASLISSIAFTLWYFILKQYKASEIAFLRLFIPFFGTFLSAILLGEKLSIAILIGLVFVIFGIIIINRHKNYEIKNK